MQCRECYFYRVPQGTYFISDSFHPKQGDTYNKTK